MPKKWYHYLVTHDSLDKTSEVAGDAREAAAEPAKSVAEIAAGVPAETPLPDSLTGTPTFEEIYAAAQIAAPAHGYSILKIADMLQSPHIASLPPEVKRKSVLLALDAAGVAVQDVIEDAVRRDRALDTFERTQQQALESLEAKVRDDSARWQSEIDTLTAERQAKIRAANEALAQEASAVRAWREQKHGEEARIAAAVGHFVSDNPVTVEGQPGPSSTR